MTSDASQSFESQFPDQHDNRALMALLALTLTSGEYKQAAVLSWIPFDITIVLLLLTLALTVRLVLTDPTVNLRPVLAVAIPLLVLMVLPALWTDWTPYAQGKFYRIAVFIPVALVVPLLASRSMKDVLWFLGTLAAIGMLASVAAIWGVVHDPDALRANAFEGNTIGLGRIAGITLLVLAIASISGASKAGWLAVLTPLPAVALVASGSRGPLLAAILCLGVFLALRLTLKRRIKLLALMLVGGFAVFMAWPFLPAESTARSTTLGEGSPDTSAAARIVFAETAIDAIAAHPGGLGWGGFVAYVPGSNEVGAYPHNLPLELLVEAGWLIGLVLVLFMLILLVRGFRSRNRSLIQRAVAIIALFLGLNSLVSGDISDNRLMFALMAMGVAFPTQTPPAHFSSGRLSALNGEITAALEHRKAGRKIKSDPGCIH